VTETSDAGPGAGGDRTRRRSDRGIDRRTLFRAAVGAAVAAGGLRSLAGVAGAQTAADRDPGWPQFGFDAANTGYNPSTAGPKRDVHARWTVDTGTPVRTGPVVSAGTVYVNADQLYALDAETGSERWTFGPSGGGTTPAVAGETVFACGSGGTLYAVDAADGSERWSTEAGEDPGPPTVDDERVFVASGRDDTVRAFDADSGDRLWENRKPSHDNVHSEAPAAVDGSVYPAGRDVTALSAGDGTLQWSQNRDNRHAPTVRGDDLYTVGNDTLHELDATGGHNRQTGVGREILTSVTATRNTLFVGNRDDNLYALETDLSTRWRFDAGDDVNAAPAVADGVVYAGSNDRHVYAVDVTSGEELWRYETGRVVKSPPAVVDGTVYVGSDDGRVYALAAAPTTSMDVVVEGAPNGIQQYEVSVDGPAQIREVTPELLTGDEFEVLSGGADETAVSVRGVDLGESVGSFSGTRTLFRVNYLGDVAAGDLSLSVARLRDDSGASMDASRVALSASPLFTDPIPGTGASAPPTDPDGDGLYEDVNGDGTVDFDDAVALAFADTGDLTPEQRDALDFDRDGDVDFADAVELAFQV
jgi:outer membrane protein assembly factor BamB